MERPALVLLWKKDPTTGLMVSHWEREPVAVRESAVASVAAGPVDLEVLRRKACPVGQMVVPNVVRARKAS